MGSKRNKRERGAASRKRAERHKTGFERTSLNIPEGASMFNIKGKTVVRIDVIPYIVGKGNPMADVGEVHWERTFYVHRGIGANQDTFVCPAKTAGLPCPICEYVVKMRRDPNSDEKMIKGLEPKERQLFNVIDKSEPDKGIQIFDISFYLFGKMLDARLAKQDEDDDFDSFYELEGGQTLKLGVEEAKSGGYSWAEVDQIDFKPRRKDLDAKLLDEAYVLDDLLAILPYKKLEAVFLQTADVHDDDTPETEPAEPAEPEETESEEEPAEPEETESAHHKRPKKPQQSKDDTDDWDLGDWCYVEYEDGFLKARISEIDTDDEEATVDLKIDDTADIVPLSELFRKDPTPKAEKKGKTKKDSSAPNTSKKSGRKSTKADESKADKEKGDEETLSCPHGGTFGEDTETLDECDECKVWDECDAKKHS